MILRNERSELISIPMLRNGNSACGLFNVAMGQPWIIVCWNRFIWVAFATHKWAGHSVSNAHAICKCDLPSGIIIGWQVAGAPLQIAYKRRKYAAGIFLYVPRSLNGLNVESALSWNWLLDQGQLWINILLALIIWSIIGVSLLPSFLAADWKILIH